MARNINIHRTICLLLVTASLYYPVQAQQPGSGYLGGTFGKPLNILRIKVNAGPDQAMAPGSSITLSANASGGVPGYAYNWQPATGLDNPNISNPVASPPATTTYVVVGTDGNGCSSSDTVIVTVAAGTATLSGNINYDNTGLTPMNNTTVYLKQGNTLVDQEVTGANGEYSFDTIPVGTYKLFAQTNKVWGGVNSADALLIMKHFVGLSLLTGLRAKAANVNFINPINSIDALLVAKRFTGIISSFLLSCDTCDWASETPVVAVTSAGTFVQNLRALCYGDVNGSYVPNAKLSPTVFIDQEGAIETQAGTDLWVPIAVSSDISIGSISLVLNYPLNTTILDVITNDPDAEKTIFRADAGELRIAWYSLEPMELHSGDILCKLKVRIDDMNDVALVATMESAISDEDATIYEKVRLIMPKVIIRKIGEYFLCHNVPNPFTGITHISYAMPENGLVSLFVFDVTGNQVACLINKEPQQTGLHEVSFDGSSYAPGVYLYQVIINGSSSSFTKSFRMVVE